MAAKRTVLVDLVDKDPNKGISVEEAERVLKEYGFKIRESDLNFIQYNTAQARLRSVRRYFESIKVEQYENGNGTHVQAHLKYFYFEGAAGGYVGPVHKGQASPIYLTLEGKLPNQE